MLDIRTGPLALCPIILEDYLKGHPDFSEYWFDGPLPNIQELAKHDNVRISDCVQQFMILPMLTEAQLIDGIPAFLRKLSMLAKDWSVAYSEPIVSFHGKHEVFSNFTPTSQAMMFAIDSPVTRDYHKYPTVEHAFVAAKCANVADRLQIAQLGANYAGQAKRIGRKVTLRNDWNEIRLSVMHYLLQQKFEQYQTPESEQLNATGYRVLVEGNTWGDTTWGICDKRGTNWLGLLLMAIRADQRH